VGHPEDHAGGFLLEYQAARLEPEAILRRHGAAPDDLQRLHGAGPAHREPGHNRGDWEWFHRFFGLRLGVARTSFFRVGAWKTRTHSGRAGVFSLRIICCQSWSVIRSATGWRNS